MKRLVIFAIASGLIWAISGTAYGKIIHVPSPEYPTIQEGIIAAIPGDTVQVAAGTYYENITMKSGVVIQGAGQAISIIDGGGNGSVVTAASVDSTATLDGFTITNGVSADGGGMYNSYSSPTVTNCTFSGNSAADDGGGMYNYVDSSPTLSNCTFSGNSATYGGGMYNLNSSPTVANCTFSGNSADYGGGMYNDWYVSSPTVTNCTFSGNSATYEGGGMENIYGSSPTVSNCIFSGNSATAGGGMRNIYQSSPTVTNCTFSGNSATYEGGGMANEVQSSPIVTNCTFSENTGAHEGGGILTYNYSSPTVTNCTFSKNSASFGGGMLTYDNSSSTVTNCTFSGNSATTGGGMLNGNNSSSTLTNCTFSGNSAGYFGGGMCNDFNSSPTVTNCTFSGNSAGYYGGGMYNELQSSPTVTNCILWGDSPEEIFNFSSTVSVTYSDIQGGYPGTGNINEDPMFVDAANGDLHLQPFSPCIDAGDNLAPALPATDIDGDNRRIDDPEVADTGSGTPPIVDMGADEYVPSGGCPHCGDVNLDDDLTPGDALLALKHYLDIADPPLNPCQLDQAEVTLDEDITPADALCIFQKYLGIPSCLDDRPECPWD